MEDIDISELKTMVLKIFEIIEGKAYSLQLNTIVNVSSNFILSVPKNNREVAMRDIIHAIQNIVEEDIKQEEIKGGYH